MSLGNKMFKGALWNAFERLSSQSVQFVVNIILARLLTPEDYGVIGLIVIFIVISEVFVDSGFTKALIQKKDRTTEDISTVFLFNLLISICCYIVLWLSSSFIADFFEISILKILLRVMALSLITNALFAVPRTLFSIKLDFKTPAKIYFIATVLCGSIAILLAYLGYGVWALVWQTLIRSLIIFLGTWLSLKWYPKLIFSKSSFRHMFSYGSRLLLASLLQRIFSKFNQFLIGKYIGASGLGIFSRSAQFTNFIFFTFSSITNNVFLPSLAPMQDNKKVLTQQTKRIVSLSALVSLPVFIGLFVLAEPLVLVLLTEKWIMTVPIIQIFCVSKFITTLSNINVNLLYVLGKTNLVLRQEYFKIAVRIGLVIPALKYGLIYIALAELVSSFVHFFINSYYPGKFMNFGALKQLKSIGFILMIGALMLIVMLVISSYIENNYLKIVFSSLAGAVTYFFAVYSANIPEYHLIYSKIMNQIRKKP